MTPLWRMSRPRGLAIAAVLAVAATGLATATAPPALADQPPQFVDSWGSVPAEPGDLDNPRSVAVGPTGEVYVLDTDRDLVLVYGADGTYLRSWADATGRAITVSPTTGNVWLVQSCDVEERTPAGVLVRSFNQTTWNGCEVRDGLALTLAANGDVYVIENVPYSTSDTERIYQFSSTGQRIRSWGTVLPDTADGGLRDPRAIVVGANGNLYVVDAGRGDVQEFTPTGTFVRKWGTEGSGPGQLAGPTAMAVAADGSLVVADPSTARIQRFDPLGTQLGEFGSEGRLPTQFTNPDLLSVQNLGVAIHPTTGDVLVADTSNRRVQRFSAAGALLDLWGWFEASGRVLDPFAVASDADGNAYVTEQRAHRVEVFDPDGTFLRSWSAADNDDDHLLDPAGIAVDTADGDVYVADSGHARIQRYDSDGTLVSAWGQLGTGPGQLTRPTYVALDGLGHLYVSDPGNGRIVQYTTTGVFVRAFGSRGTGDGQFDGITGIAIGADGTVYVGDNNRATNGASVPRVQRFSATGAYLGKWGTRGTADGQFGAVNGLAVSAAGRVLVTDCDSVDQVQVFDATGAFLTSWDIDDEPEGTGCPLGVALSGRSVYLAAIDGVSGPESDRVLRYDYPTGPLTSVEVTVDETTADVGDTIHFHVTVNNLGGVTLTDVETTDTAGSSCTRAVPDVAVGDRQQFDCTYELTAADSGWFSNAVSVTTAQGATATSAPARVDVEAFGAPATLHTWWPTATGTDDADGPDLSLGGLSADDEHVYVTGTRKPSGVSAVQRFDHEATFEHEFGTTGLDPGQLDRPLSVAPAPDGTIFTADCGGGRITQFTAGGQLLSYWLEPRSGPVQTCSPADVAVGPDGRVVTLDVANNRVDALVDNALAPLVGSAGSGNGQFNAPTNLVVGPDGTIYVADTGNDRVQRFAADGSFLSAWGGSGTHNGQFQAPTDIAVDASGRVYVSDPTANRIQVFTAEGQYLAKWAADTVDIAVQTRPDGTVLVHAALFATSSGLAGSITTYAFPDEALLKVTLTPAATQVDPGRTVSYQLRLDNLGAATLTGLAVDPGVLSGCGGPTGDLAPGATRTLTCTYVPGEAQSGELHARVSVDSDQTPPTRSNNTWVEVLLRKVQRWGSTGAGQNRFLDPDGVAVRGQRVYVADCGNNRVQQFDRHGAFVRAWGGAGTANGQFDCPTDLTITSLNNLLVVDRGNGRVQEFTADGVFVRAWSTQTPAGSQPRGVEVDDFDNVYVTDRHPSASVAGANTVRRFSPEGTLLTTFSPSSSAYPRSGLWIAPFGVVWVTTGVGLTAYSPTGAVLHSFNLGSNTGFRAHDVAMDLDGHLWVTLPGQSEVRKLTQRGVVLGRWSIPAASGISVFGTDVYVATTNDRVVKLGMRDAGTGIAGRITSDGTGDGIAGGAVLALRRDDYTLLAAANADANGDYQLTLPPGDYAIEFADPSGAHGYEWYEDRPTPEGITTVQVTQGSFTPVSAAISPSRGAVAGTVTDSDTGDPIAGVTVLAARTGTQATTDDAVGGRAVTDAAGHYRISDLAPGDHQIVFLDLANRYDGVGIQPVSVTAGTTPAAASAALDDHAPITGSVTGTVRDTTGSTTSPVGGMLVVGLDPADLHLTAATTTAADGTYRLDVPSGDHYLAFVDPLNRHTFEWFDDQTNPASFASLTRVQGGSTADATVARTRGDITGTISGNTEGVAVLAVNPTGIIGAAASDSTGRYTIAHVAPGSYLMVFIDPSGNRQTNFYRDQTTTTAAARITVSAGQRTSLGSQSMAPW